jgi:hypothetical protein
MFSRKSKNHMSVNLAFFAAYLHDRGHFTREEASKVTDELMSYKLWVDHPSLKHLEIGVVDGQQKIIAVDKSDYEFILAFANYTNLLAQPPLNAQFLLDLFLPDDVCEAFLGDLQERYARKLPRLGKQRADWWYRKQVLTSLWPLARSFGRRVSLGFVWRIGAFVLRLIGFPALADALRKAAEEERKRVS